MKRNMFGKLMFLILLLCLVSTVSANVTITNSGSAGGFVLNCPVSSGTSCSNLGCSGSVFGVEADSDVDCIMTSLTVLGGAFPYLGENFDPACFVGTAPECVLGNTYTIHAAPFGGSVSAYFDMYSPFQNVPFTFTSNTYGPPIASFAANPSSGYAPLTVDFTDTSTGPLIDEWIWDFGDGSTVYGPNLSTTQNVFGTGNFTVRMTVTNNTYGTSNTTQTISVLSPTGINVKLDVRDSISGALLTDTQVGIMNTTDNAWRNSTMPYGLGVFDSTNPSNQYPLSIGQTITLAASKTGYSSESSTFTIPYSGYLTTLYLTPDGSQPTNGNWNLVVTVKRNLDGVPIPNANVRLQTGVGTQYDVTQYTNTQGTTTFTNVTASTSALVSVVSQLYQDTTATVPVITPNGTQHLTIQMILKGGTPVTTPITPRPTGTPYDPNAPAAYPTPVDANGNPITDSSLKGFAAFGLLIDAAYAIMQIVVGIVFIWLLWLTVYMITGGKIIDKIMRRGRR